MIESNLPIAPLPAPGFQEWILWILRRRIHLRVTGGSMLPTLAAGDLVLVDSRAYRDELPAPGEVVVARHPYQRDLRLIKRVATITEEGRVFLQSDNPREGSDSRHFGALSPQRLVGRVTARVPVPK
jgi:nickel-type superoxide dismutase maturation protease